jgi:acetyl-CoA carboxylase biotin carboxyl carrier protein
MNIEEISQVAELMSKHDLTEFVVESDEMKLVLKRGGVAVPMMAPAVAAAPAAAPVAAPASNAPAEEESAATINSPLVGTFYAAASPDAPPFVKVGDEVSDDTVICIVEAMKVMNEIKAECRGRIKRLMVENATSVEYGQPLFEIESV